MEFSGLVWPRSKLPGFEGITATEGQLFRSCSAVSPGALARTLCSNESGAAHFTGSEACDVEAIAPGVNAKGRGFLRGLLHLTLFSVAVGFLSSGRCRYQR